MFVGDEDAINAIAADAERFEAAVDFFFAEAGIDEETSAVGFQQRGVAGAARRQNRDLQPDGQTPR